jgi:hypothetical protein
MCKNRYFLLQRNLTHFCIPVKILHRENQEKYKVQNTMGIGSFPGIKRPGRGADHPPPSKRRGHERLELYLYSPSGPSWPVKGWTFTFNFLQNQIRNNVSWLFVTYGSISTYGAVVFVFWSWRDFKTPACRLVNVTPALA